MRRPERWRRWLAAVLVAASLALAAGFALVFLTHGEGEATFGPIHHPLHPPPAAQPPPPPPVPEQPRASTRSGVLVVDGRPLFPIMSWGECTDGFKTSLAVGTNLYAANRCGGIEAQVSALGHHHALSAVVAGETRPAGAPVIGTFYPDEPDAHGTTGAELPDLPSNAGVRFLTLTNHFYSGAAPLVYGRGLYPGLVDKADMVGFDLYPLQNWCQPSRLVDVYLAQRELTALAKGKPTFQWIEAAGMTCPHDGPTAVTPDTVRAESWLAIAGGARGLGFFPPAAWTGDVGQAIGNVTGAIRSLTPLLLAPDADVRVDPDGLVKAGARRRGNRLLVVAVNAGYTPATATIAVPGLAGRSLHVVGSGRSVVPEGDSFTERFPPLAARVYVTGATSS